MKTNYTCINVDVEDIDKFEDVFDKLGFILVKETAGDGDGVFLEFQHDGDDFGDDCGYCDDCEDQVAAEEKEFIDELLDVANTVAECIETAEGEESSDGSPWVGLQVIAVDTENPNLYVRYTTGEDYYCLEVTKVQKPDDIADLEKMEEEGADDE